MKYVICVMHTIYETVKVKKLTSRGRRVWARLIVVVL